MRWKVLDYIFRSVSAPPPSNTDTPTEDEKLWAMRESEARVRRLRELGVFVDLKRIENGPR